MTTEGWDSATSEPLSTPTEFDQSRFPQQFQVDTKGPLGGRILELRIDLLALPLPPVAQDFQQDPLPVGQVVADPQRGDIPAGEEPDDHIAGLLQELRLGVPR